MTNMWQKEIETMHRQDMEALQLERLKWSVQYSYDCVPFYREKMDACGVRPEDIKSLSDIQRLPYTTKADLQQCYPYGTFAQPLKQITRIQGSSGTKGKPTIVGYTKNDLNNWTDLVARVVVAAGITDEDVVQISFNYGLFTGAFGLHQGLERIGATVVPLSAGNTERQLMMLKDLGVSALVATPSYAMYLSELIEERGLKHELNLRIGLLGSEACSEEALRLIENKSGMLVTDNYGMSELFGPGVAGECVYRDGLHFAEDHFLPEIIDYDTLEVLGAGEVGELVVTSLTKEAMPLIRYRTGDITRINYEPCQCGRTSARIDKIKGRVDDMIIVKGVNIFPSQVEHVLAEIAGISPHYLLVLYRDGLKDALEIQVELNDEMYLQDSKIHDMKALVAQKLRSTLGMRVKVTLLKPKSLERFSGKAKRIVDLRNA